ncbi:MAG: ankyrin repeat domain-containing protein [Terriglobales bacterium]
MFPNPQDALPLPQRPNLEQYRKLAKDLLRAAKSGRDSVHDWAKRWIHVLVRQSGIVLTPNVPVRIERWTSQVGEYATRELVDKNGANLAKAQFIIARCQGFVSWPKLVKHINGAAKKSSPESQFEAAADAIVSGDHVTLRRLLRVNPKLVRQRSTREHKATLLHYVSANGVEGYRQKTPKNIVVITKLLLNAGADVDAECDVYGGGATALGLAATSCHPEAAGVQGPLMQILLDHGATLDQPGVAGNKHSAVIGCLANGRGRAAEYLAEHGAELDMECAAGTGRLDVVKSFYNEDGTLKSTATEQQVRDGFMWACQFGRDEIVSFFLEHGVPASTIGVRRKIPGLHWAAYGGHAKLVRLLLERGALVNAVEPEFDGTPLGWALYGWGEGHPGGDYYGVAAQLVRAGAAVKDKWLNEEGEYAEMARRIKSDARMLAALRGEQTN